MDQSFSRRQVIRGAAAALIGSQLPRVDRAYAQERREEGDAVSVCDQRMTDWYNSDPSVSMPSVERGPEEVDAVREAFTRDFGKDFRYIGETLVAGLRAQPVPDETLDSLIDMCSDVEHSELAISALRNAGRYAERFSIIGAAEYFRSRASDDLPRGHEIEPGEIDQRRLLIDHPNLYAQLFGRAGIGEATSEAQESIRTFPGWSDSEKMSRVRRALDSAGIRAAFQLSDCTLAEVYSCLKVIIEESDAEVSIDKVKELLLRREVFLQREVLSPRTQHFIYATYHTAEGSSRDPLHRVLAPFNPGVPEVLANLCQVPMEARHKVHTSDFSLARMELHRAIAQSQGATTLFFNTHGYDDGLAIRDSGYSFFSSTDIARALIARVERTGDLDTLKDMNMITSACYSADMIEHVFEHLRERFGGTGLALPCVITPTQKGNYAYQGSLLSPLFWRTNAIERHGVLNGGMLMRAVQPAGYFLSDMSIVAGNVDAPMVIG